MRHLLLLALVGPTLLTSCASRVWMMVPANVGLTDTPRIGIVAFEGTHTPFDGQATRDFKQRVLSARPGVRILDLESADAAADVDAVFVGHVEFSEPAPTIGIGASLIEVQARAEVRGTLSVQMLDPETGAATWMRSSTRKATVGHVGLDTEGSGSAGYTDVAGIKASMVSAMAEDVTWDFRDRWIRKKREQIPPHYVIEYQDGEECYVPPERAR